MNFKIAYNIKDIKNNGNLTSEDNTNYYKILPYNTDEELEPLKCLDEENTRKWINVLNKKFTEHEEYQETLQENVNRELQGIYDKLSDLNYLIEYIIETYVPNDKLSERLLSQTYSREYINHTESIENHLRIIKSILDITEEFKSHKSVYDNTPLDEYDDYDDDLYWENDW